ARDGPRTDAGAHLQLFGALVPEPRRETGQPGRARVDADPGRRDLPEDGAPDLADARHGRRGRGRGEAAVGFKREAADLLVDDGAGEVGDDERVRPTPPVAAARPRSRARPPRTPPPRPPVSFSAAARSVARAPPPPPPPLCPRATMPTKKLSPTTPPPDCGFGSPDSAKAIVGVIKDA